MASKEEIIRSMAVLKKIDKYKFGSSNQKRKPRVNEAGVKIGEPQAKTDKINFNKKVKIFNRKFNKKPRISPDLILNPNEEERSKALEVIEPSLKSYKKPTPIIAMDCEMVDCSKIKRLARVSIINYNGHVLMDQFIKPEEKITDFLTHVSGITPIMLRNAPTLENVREKILELFKDRIIVGHSIFNDFEVLDYKHSARLVRDVCFFSGYRYDGKSTKLKTLCADILGISIQGSSHSSVEDARATLALYRLNKRIIDDELKFKKIDQYN